MGVPPKNGPADKSFPYGTIKISKPSTNMIFAEYFDVNGTEMVNIYSGNPLKWSGWNFRSFREMVSQDDLTKAVDTVKAYVDSKIS